ncbi:BEACH domain-containing protein [Chloropicon primus]|uniref:BEACH domain-containing protein n=1 Tax=Chloropicon primus TaxID=1764295 RepID=A0A5B8MG44_9CHLO|nr:BEACH domain-containing protein [Chloropicon primus]UPQ97520.1 BEACH domain-containing protein [Chloropicon primus]|eukprot:QDZ18310.1 BEACH domain-containing protein [Chloropicon primus]
MKGWKTRVQRFSLLLLQEGEYYFRDYNCIQLSGSNIRLEGQLKICSSSIYYVPQNLNEPVFRLPYQSITGVHPSDSEDDLEVFEVAAVERIDMKTGNRNIPYIWNRGQFLFKFALTYTDLETVLAQIQKLIYISTMAEGPGREEMLQEVIDAHEESVQFSPGWFMDDGENIQLELTASRVTPLCWHRGRLVISPLRVYFLPFNVVSSAPLLTYSLKDVVTIQTRTHQLQDIGIELFFSGGKSVYFAFKGADELDKFYLTLVSQPSLTIERERSLKQRTKDWASGKISNFDYLMFLNSQANRSFNDLTQYPIFPWVLSDYESEVLDLNNKNIYRDLTKPIGALQPQRLQNFLARYNEMKRMFEEARREGQESYTDVPFMYGCHYSTPGYVVYYLLRDKPQLMLKLQNGRFDSPDRLLCSIKETWESVLSLPTDLKELIPEFYSDSPDFLVNNEGLDFGVRQSGKVVNNVELPPWASDAKDFQTKMRAALESNYVSANLHHWIDLIFGYKQRGLRAEKSFNIFPSLTYDDNAMVCLDNETDDRRLKAMNDQIREFGRTPSQLYITPHPKRNVTYISIRERFINFKMRVLNSLSIPKGFPCTKKKMDVERALKLVLTKGNNDTAYAKKWLEITALTDCAKLTIKKTVHAQVLVNALKSKKLAKKKAAIQVIGILMKQQANVELLMGVGLQEPFYEAMCCGDTDIVECAVDLILIMSVKHSDFIEKFNVDALAALKSLINSRAERLQIKCVKALGELGKFRNNRSRIIQLNSIQAMREDLLNTRKPNLSACILETLSIISADSDAFAKIQEMDLLKHVLNLCQYPEPKIQNAATMCLAALSAHNGFRLEIAQRGGLSILCSSSCSADPKLQEASSSALSNMFADTSVIDTIVREEGLWSIISMANSPSQKIQRHAARAFWHLAVHHENKKLLYDLGGLQSLVKLAKNGERNIQSTLLAEEAINRLSEDNFMRVKIDEEFGFARGKPPLDDDDDD